MNVNPKRLMLAGAFLALAISAPALADDWSEEAISMQDLPAAVADTMQSELGGKQPEEVEKIIYEGMVVLYEAEWYENGEEYEIYFYPNGEFAGRHSHEEEDEGEY